MYSTKTGGGIDGFLYLKTEDGPLADVFPPLPPARRIKVGTLKINAHGTKLGERFLKKIFDHAIFIQAKEIYVTVFEHHAGLLGLLERFGFVQKAKKTTPNGTELVLVREIKSPYEDVVKSYPQIQLRNTQAYLLSLLPIWHTRLLPDSILKNESANIVEDISHANSIHKVYLTAMKGTAVLKKGDNLIIYRTTVDEGRARHQSVATSICVIEEYRSIYSFASREEFLLYCRPYSIFTEAELIQFWASKKYPHIIRFTYNIALNKRITRGELLDEVGLNGSSYWGFMPINHQQFIDIAKRGKIDESLIIHQA